jgi:HlyD family secretion protein
MANHSRRKWKKWSNPLTLGILILTGVGGGTAYQFSRRVPDLPNEEVKFGEFLDYVQVRGELKALKSIVMTAPARAGDLQIIKLLKSGTLVKKGDIVVQLDTSNLESQLNEHKSGLRQADAEIERTVAQGRLQEEQNVTLVMKSKYDVERARLEASKQEILSKIDGEKNKLLLSNAQQRVLETDQKVDSDRNGYAADTAARKVGRKAEEYEVNETERRLAEMNLRAPIDGMVTLLPNFRNRSGFGFGSNAPEFKEGDKTYPHAAIAELPDLSTLRISARIDETDRGRIKLGNTVKVNVDALPDKELEGVVTEISTLARNDFSTWPPPKNFDIVVTLNQLDSRLRPGMSANVRVLVEQVPNSLMIKPEALFQRGRQYFVFVLKKNNYSPHAVQVLRRTKGQLVIAGDLRKGDRVALKDPEMVEGKSK